MKLGILFSGQGAQKAGMGLDLYQNIPAYQATVDQASSILGYDLQEVANDDAKIKQTAYAQPAILTMSNAIINALGDALPTPVAGLGLSLGEYSALSASGALDFDQAVAIIKDRGMYMQTVGDANPGKMVAVMGDNQKLVADVLTTLQADGKHVYPANYNTFAQLVIGGVPRDVDVAMTALSEAGIQRMVELPVSGAFHTPLLTDAATQLTERLSGETFRDMQYPVYSNTTGKQFTKEMLFNTLTKQIISPTYFAQAMQNMLDLGVDTFLEVGPSDTLIKFAKKIAPKDVKRYAITDLESFNAVKEMLVAEGENV
ncbi:malonyl CoA-acyl carrier protein transacylase [Leuconostoc gasicomitatum]|uniref:Malonyl CoA-acyl carrier protein transacylase n=2 Tax=Leuconostoc TaxID=1243 RepID=A0AAN2QUX6_9LACO|nr:MULTISPECIES: ACP S-malonyltransferase [Leuconostoc]MBZ5945155.1 ACP S-malonyltransferase [Leuconostoc gasicomitatum]MBZ5957258.1 ACP S-malonyltransferase [Leuconostoc gasicomitatum]MBZ5958600.1 ACP S-malonyltransferase [Leuconostoc gasicomitatum]MBZ5962137.1 ACP S-malonyltransferase [Leuconostoc gasicomitatum]MBZ5966192.1 ACP S-malonyltransferase [Leuconostoc gasicomitatum]